MNSDYYNASGCADPTAYEALRNLRRAEINGDVTLLIKVLREIITDSGFMLLNRIELKEIKSGKAFK